MQLSELVYEMSQTMDTQTIVQILHRFVPDSKLLSFQQLTGGVSAQVIAIEFLNGDSQKQQWVLRLHGDHDRQRNPQIARDEFRLYQILQSAGIPAPTPYFLDNTCDFLPIPYLIMEFVMGKTTFAPVDVNTSLSQMAYTLAEIHQASIDVSFLPNAKVRYKARFQSTASAFEPAIQDA